MITIEELSDKINDWLRFVNQQEPATEDDLLNLEILLDLLTVARHRVGPTELLDTEDGEFDPPEAAPQTPVIDHPMPPGHPRRVQRDLLAIPAFNGLDGRFDRAAYREALRRNGMNEAQFEAKIRDDAARTLVQAAVAGGMTAPQSYVGSVLSYITETRDARHIRLSEQTLATLFDPASYLHYEDVIFNRVFGNV